MTADRGGLGKVTKMTQMKFARRQFLIGSAAMITIAATPLVAMAATPTLRVLKDPYCGCCGAWIEILRRDGLEVTSEDVDAELLMRFKLENGIPGTMISCHTAQVDGYLIEGHVPTADIRRLLDERPDAVGLSVPGMPFGSPGMGPEDERDAYDVYLILHDGRTEVFTRYDPA